MNSGVRYLLNVQLPLLPVSRLGLCIPTALWLAIVRRSDSRQVHVGHARRHVTLLTT